MYKLLCMAMVILVFTAGYTAEPSRWRRRPRAKQRQPNVPVINNIGNVKGCSGDNCHKEKEPDVVQPQAIEVIVKIPSIKATGGKFLMRNVSAVMAQNGNTNSECIHIKNSLNSTTTTATTTTASTTTATTNNCPLEIPLNVTQLASLNLRVANVVSLLSTLGVNVISFTNSTLCVDALNLTGLLATLNSTLSGLNSTLGGITGGLGGVTGGLGGLLGR